MSSDPLCVSVRPHLAPHARQQIRVKQSFWHPLGYQGTETLAVAFKWLGILENIPEIQTQN